MVSEASGLEAFNYNWMVCSKTPHAYACIHYSLLKHLTLPLLSDPRCLLLSPVVDCGALSDPLHGMVDIPQGTTFYAMATYSCNSSHVLVGDETRTCQADGDWSGRDPTCSKFEL